MLIMNIHSECAFLVELKKYSSSNNRNHSNHKTTEICNCINIVLHLDFMKLKLQSNAFVAFLIRNY